MERRLEQRDLGRLEEDKGMGHQELGGRCCPEGGRQWRGWGFSNPLRLLPPSLLPRPHRKDTAAMSQFLGGISTSCEYSRISQ